MMTTPENKPDTGLLWAGWHRAASESVMHATRDNDPRCVVAFAKEGLEAGREAIREAKNARQRADTESLLDAAHKVKAIGEKYLDAGAEVMGDDNDY
jgi:hypothetical protein